MSIMPSPLGLPLCGGIAALKFTTSAPFPGGFREQTVNVEWYFYCVTLKSLEFKRHFAVNCIQTYLLF
ncbi:hypothetical protein NADFUDRAFT_84191 [Nadsonia fulvescens var. elongata DSM 6958]|uniref:Uncharacterized protein n=1 Tax=Nadsonia fulvescens var. elongata DSM 6958 TaxID=857566 RepID=A0A1E3PDP8_9ASCO|nr:hypothetical protein NADFUDRAFT_84191 [Nadsonia fulvescens var. elongata DSM 6958]